MSSLDRSYFAQLPDEVLCLILARLPLESLAQSRAVCKKWHAVTTNCSNLRSVDRVVPADRTWFLYGGQGCHRRRLWYKLRSDKNHRITFCSLTCRRVEKVLATAGGLMLCAISPYLDPENGRYCQELSVCNPLKLRCWMRLPERPCASKPEMVGMVSHHYITTTFKVVLVNWSTATTEVYDSTTKTWKVVASSHPSTPPWWRECVMVPGVFHGNFLLCFDSGYGILVFDSKTAMWSSIDLPERTINNQLEDYRGRLFLMGETISAQLKVWEFHKAREDAMTGSWLSISECTRLRLLLDSSFWRTVKVWSPLSGSSLARTPVLTYSRCSLALQPDTRILLFSVAEKLWYQAERSKCRMWRDNFWDALMFTPQIEACVCNYDQVAHVQ